MKSVWTCGDTYVCNVRGSSVMMVRSANVLETREMMCLKFVKMMRENDAKIRRSGA